MNQTSNPFLEQLGPFAETITKMSEWAVKQSLENPFMHAMMPPPNMETPDKHWSKNVKVDASRYLQQQQQFLEQQQKLWHDTVLALWGQVATETPTANLTDKRFAHDDWQSHPMFSFIKQSYLLQSQFINNSMDVLEFEDSKVEEQFRFYTRQLVNSMSPANFAFTNPEVCREIMATQGECLAKGLDRFYRDLETSPREAFKISHVDANAFELGRHLAATKGAVIYKNALIELIHYSPRTPRQFEVPLLIVPPFINKYYILDLGEQKSLVRWLLDQGHDVYLISWKNPNGDYRDYTLDHYVSEGVLAALNVVKTQTLQPHIHVAGYCIGGTLAAMASAYLAACQDKSMASLTLLTTLLDFSEPGEVGNYMNGQLMPFLEQTVQSHGYLDGRILALGFSLLRENHLFWSFFVEHYLKGKDPTPFDILYWNGDSTNFPAAAYLYYLQHCYIQNDLIQANKLNVLGVPLDLSNIKLPIYALAAQTDHIVMWTAAYKSLNALQGEKRFVLGQSGHVAGVVNPIGSSKYGHFVNTSWPEVPDQWLATAEYKAHSWWTDWAEWLMDRSGAQVTARPTATDGYPAVAAAPGEYVKERLDGLPDFNHFFKSPEHQEA